MLGGPSRLGVYFGWWWFLDVNVNVNVVDEDTFGDVVIRS